MTRRPDIVFLVLDTQRADRLSCYGHHLETTPHIDAFASDATLFRRAVSAAQWTIPSHTSMFTGLYPSAHTTVQSFSRIPPTLTTLPERLRDGGYYTAAFCNNPLVGVVNNGLRRGFQSFLNYSGLMTSRPNQAGMRRHGPIDHWRQFFKRFLMAFFGRLQDSFARSEKLLDFSFSPLMVPLWQTALSFKGNTARSLNDAAHLLTTRKGLQPDQPVFSFINLMSTHTPYHPPHHAMERFAPHVLHNKEARRYLRRFNGDIYGWLAPLAGAIDHARKAIIDGMYNAEVYGQDALVGQFLNHLRSSGALDNTLVVIVADHGDHLGEKQLVGHLFSVYNELVHVPLIIRDPAGTLPHGSSIEQVVSTRRLFQTVLTTAGLATSDERRLALMHNEAADPEQGRVFAEGIPPENVVNLLRRRAPDLIRTRLCDQTRRAAWHNDYKLIQTGDDLSLELYRVPDDPHEQHNLHDVAPHETRELQWRLHNFVRQTSYNAPTAEQIEEETEPEISRRLRDLGYIE